MVTGIFVQPFDSSKIEEVPKEFLDDKNFIPEIIDAFRKGNARIGTANKSKVLAANAAKQKILSDFAPDLPEPFTGFQGSDIESKSPSGPYGSWGPHGADQRSQGLQQDGVCLGAESSRFRPNDPPSKVMLDYMQNPKRPDEAINQHQSGESLLENTFAAIRNEFGISFGSANQNVDWGHLSDGTLNPLGVLANKHHAETLSKNPLTEETPATKLEILLKEHCPKGVINLNSPEDIKHVLQKIIDITKAEGRKNPFENYNHKDPYEALGWKPRDTYLEDSIKNSLIGALYLEHKSKLGELPNSKSQTATLCPFTNHNARFNLENLEGKECLPTYQAVGEENFEESQPSKILDDKEKNNTFIADKEQEGNEELIPKCIDEHKEAGPSSSIPSVAIQSPSKPSIESEDLKKWPLPDYQDNQSSRFIWRSLGKVIIGEGKQKARDLRENISPTKLSEEQSNHISQAKTLSDIQDHARKISLTFEQKSFIEANKPITVDPIEMAKHDLILKQLISRYGVDITRYPGSSKSETRENVALFYEAPLPLSDEALKLLGNSFDV